MVFASTLYFCKRIKCRCLSGSKSQLFQVYQIRNSKTRCDYHAYDASLCARIGNYATQHGMAVATRHFEQELKRKLPESTIRKCKTDKSVTAKMQY